MADFRRSTMRSMAKSMRHSMAWRSSAGTSRVSKTRNPPSSEFRSRRGGLAFEGERSGYNLQYKSLPEAKKGILKVETLEESLASTCRHRRKSGIFHLKKQKNKQKKHVNFGQLDMRLYDVCLETNPGVSEGPAVGLDWTYEELPTSDVDTFEAFHPPRRHLIDVRMTLKERLAILQASGATEQEIREAMKRTEKAKKNRFKTLDDLDKMEHEFKKEKRFKNIRIALRLRKTDEAEEDDLWDKAQSTEMCNNMSKSTKF